MITITSTNQLPYGLYKVTQCDDKAEAAQIAAGRKSYLRRSNIIPVWYLYVPVVEAA